MNVPRRERGAGEAQGSVAQNGLPADADDDIALLQACVLRGGAVLHAAQIRALRQVVIILIDRQNVARDDAHFPRAGVFGLAVRNGDGQGIHQNVVRALADGDEHHLVVVHIDVAPGGAIPADGDLRAGKVVFIADLKVMRIDVDLADFRLLVILGIVVERRFAVRREIGIGIALGDGDVVDGIFLFDFLGEGVGHVGGRAVARVRDDLQAEGGQLAGRVVADADLHTAVEAVGRDFRALDHQRLRLV